MCRKWYFSTQKATCLVKTDNDNIITETAPIWSKFKGQHIKNLATWLRSKWGGLKYEEIKGPPNV
jgi:hypothetical protein